MKALVADISPPVDHLLASQLVAEFSSCERRFIQRDWEPAELDGGQFCEVAARIWYNADSGLLTHTKDLKDCVRYIENEQAKHQVIPRTRALHVCKLLSTIYKFRGQRGAIHISPTYTANHMDAKLMIEGVRWLMNETLLFFWTDDEEEVAARIREILQFDVPAIGTFEDRIVVQRTDLTTEEEILVLLHYSGDPGCSRTDIGKHVMKSPQAISNALTKLRSSSLRQIVQLSGDRYRLTELGSRRIRLELAEKLLIE